MVPEWDEDIPVRVINVSDNPVTLEAGTVVTDLEVVQVCNAEESASNGGESPAPELVSVASEVDQLLTDEENSQLLSLLDEFSDTFSSSENDLGWTDVVTHTIDTGDSQPIRQPLRRHPLPHLDAIQHHVCPACWSKA